MHTGKKYIWELEIMYTGNRISKFKGYKKKLTREYLCHLYARIDNEAIKIDI